MHCYSIFHKLSCDEIESTLAINNERQHLKVFYTTFQGKCSKELYDSNKMEADMVSLLYISEPNSCRRCLVS